MMITWMISCLFFCSVLTGCSNIQNKPASDLSKIKLGEQSYLSVDLEGSPICDVAPSEEKMKVLNNFTARKEDNFEAIFGLKATWNF